MSNIVQFNNKHAGPICVVSNFADQPTLN